ncbi:hypothetical protein DSO57_1009059 [Entomophthora muscae]|uniref:Uncharacterized protein n=1 Tax=Entomophthora muscae TaxID=34485 RepID=A0ACC2RLP7_9FUNG|nr:hypothetical protein DSO57_1009059 [Entomophthora muscae]
MGLSNEAKPQENSSAPLTRVSGRIWKQPKKPFNRDSVRKFGKLSWAERMEQKEKSKAVKALEKQLKDEAIEKKKLRGERLAEKRIKQEAKLREEKLRASVSFYGFDVSIC